MKEFLFNVQEKHNNYKVIDFLKTQSFSKEIIQKVKFGGIKLNQTIISNVNHIVKTGDECVCCLRRAHCSIFKI